MQSMLDAYLRRIGAARPAAPDLATLEALHVAHLRSVPFENLDIHAGRTIELDEARIVDKLVVKHRGGFCYELNGGFAWLLRGLGFDVTILSAQVKSGDGWGIEHDHMALRIDLEQPWLVDVGFGDSFVRPIALTEGVTSEQEVGTFRLVRDAAYFVLERRGPAPELAQQYRFTLEPHRLADLAPGCAYHQSSPASHFTKSTVCSLARPWGRSTLRADRLIETRSSDKTERPIADDSAWHAALREHFGIDDPSLVRR